ncbi:hypothetical protein IW136_006509, partial [Coemansia sp. RSA 678]
MLSLSTLHKLVPRAQFGSRMGLQLTSMRVSAVAAVGSTHIVGGSASSAKSVLACTGVRAIHSTARVCEQKEDKDKNDIPAGFENFLKPSKKWRSDASKRAPKETKDAKDTESKQEPKP